MDEKWYQRVENLPAGHEYGRNKERRSIGCALDSAAREKRQMNQLALLSGFLRIDAANNRSMPKTKVSLLLVQKVQLELLLFEYLKYLLVCYEKIKNG